MLNSLEDICDLIKLRYEIAEEAMRQGIFSESWILKNIFGMTENEVKENCKTLNQNLNSD